MNERRPRQKKDPKTGKFVPTPDARRNRVYLTDLEWELIKQKHKEEQLSQK